MMARQFPGSAQYQARKAAKSAAAEANQVPEAATPATPEPPQPNDALSVHAHHRVGGAGEQRTERAVDDTEMRGGAMRVIRDPALAWLVAVLALIVASFSIPNDRMPLAIHFVVWCATMALATAGLWITYLIVRRLFSDIAHDRAVGSLAPYRTWLWLAEPGGGQVEVVRNNEWVEVRRWLWREARDFSDIRVGIALPNGAEDVICSGGITLTAPGQDYALVVSSNGAAWLVHNGVNVAELPAGTLTPQQWAELRLRRRKDEYWGSVNGRHLEAHPLPSGGSPWPKRAAVRLRVGAKAEGSPVALFSRPRIS